MTSRLVRSAPEWAVRALAEGRCFLEQHYAPSSASLHPGVQMGAGKFNAEVTLR